QINETLDPAFKQAVSPGYTFSYTDPLAGLKIPPRDYQEESIRCGLKNGNGVFVLATAAGKTLTMAILIETINKYAPAKTLIIVPSIQLVNQTYSDFIEYGIDSKRLTKWCGGSEPD